MSCEPSKRGQGCLASLEIRGAGVWAIDWMQQEDGNWLGAVAGMCKPSLCHLPRRMLLRCLCKPLPTPPPDRYSGLHLLSLSLAAGSAVLQLLHSSESIHGDGALVRCAT